MGRHCRHSRGAQHRAAFRGTRRAFGAGIWRDNLRIWGPSAVRLCGSSSDRGSLNSSSSFHLSIALRVGNRIVLMELHALPGQKNAAMCARLSLIATIFPPGTIQTVALSGLLGPTSLQSLKHLQLHPSETQHGESGDILRHQHPHACPFWLPCCLKIEQLALIWLYLLLNSLAQSLILQALHSECDSIRRTSPNILSPMT
jgi:hypothetical protein